MKRSAKTRPKPSVADVNHFHAKENIQVKIKVISTALESQSGGPVSVDDASYDVAMAIRDSLPATVRQFNLWQSEKIPEAIRIKVPGFGKNANKTLHTAGLFADVQRAVDAVSASRAKVVRGARAETISKYQGKADLAKRLREIAEDEVIGLKRRLVAALAQNTVLERKLQELQSRVAGKLKPVDNGKV